MAGQDHWVNEPRDERGRWTSGGGSALEAIRDGTDEALAALPMPVRDQFDAAVSRMARSWRACWRTRRGR